MTTNPGGRLRSVDALSIIEQRLPALSGASHRVGEAIVSDPWAILGMTIYDVAAKAGVSLPSVTRFCRAVGYNGFRELVQGIAQSLGRLDTHTIDSSSTPTDEDEGLPGLAARIVNRQIDALKATLTTINFDNVEAAVQALCKARRVYTVGHGSAYVSALGIAIKLNWAGLAAVAATPDLFSNLLISVDENDVVISISNQGRTKDVIEMQEVAREGGATTISISLVEHSPLSKSSDIPIVVLSPRLPSGSSAACRPTWRECPTGWRSVFGSDRSPPTLRMAPTGSVAAPTRRKASRVGENDGNHVAVAAGAGDRWR
jgi:RpiR family carbohydrate utilization transcriptional regulator